MIFIAGDHHAEHVLQTIRSYLRSRGEPFCEFGYKGGDRPEASLEEFIPEVARAVRDEPQGTGILVCGTGAGVEIGANRFAGIRATLCSSPQAAEWARVYDDANVLCLASWALTDDEATTNILDCWFNAKYDGDVRRREMLAAFDAWPGNAA